MKKLLSLVLAATMLFTTLFSVVIIPVSAAAGTAEFTMSNPTGNKGDIVTVDITVSENSYMVDGQLYVKFDPTMLELQQLGTEDGNPVYATVGSMFQGMMYGQSLPSAGEFRFAFAGTGAGITEGGVAFSLQFKILANNALNTSLELVCPHIGINSNGQDVEGSATCVGGTVWIADGVAPAADPYNFLQEAYIAENRQNVTINADGSWTVTGNFALAPHLTYDYSVYQYIALKMSSDVGVKITFMDDSDGQQRWIGLYDNWVGPQYFPAGYFSEVHSIKGIYDWSIANAGWGHKNNQAKVRAI